MPGCFNLAGMVEAGDGVEKNLAKAAALYRKACKEGGLQESCEKLHRLGD
jgi:TPR repeat protein